MTARDEARAKCIDALDRGVYAATGSRMSRKALTKIFDSLNGIVTVNLPEATIAMVEAARRKGYGILSDHGLSANYNTMAGTGNLTNPPG